MTCFHSQKIAAIVALSHLAMPCLLAVPDAGKPAKPAVSASLVPIGSSSDAIWVGSGPDTQAVAIDPGAAPPATLCVRDRKELKTIPGILNRPSIALPVRGGVLRVFANQNQGAEEEPPLFGEFKIPAAEGHHDIFLNRPSNRKTWDKPESLILPSGLKKFPSGTLRVINLCSQTVTAKVGPTVFELAPRRSRIMPGNNGGSPKMIGVQAMLTEDPASGAFLRTGIRMDTNLRANLVVYPSRDSRKPAKATWYYQGKPEFEPSPTTDSE